MSYGSAYYSSSYPEVNNYQYYQGQFPIASNAYAPHHAQHHSDHGRSSQGVAPIHNRHSNDRGDSPIYILPVRPSVKTYDSHYYHDQPIFSFDEHERYSSRENEPPSYAASSYPPSSPSKPSYKERVCCTHPDCLDSHRRPTKFFSRKADLARHDRSQHNVVYLDCPKKHCSRKGAEGFPRRDHLIEHLRGYHQADIPKRKSSQTGSAERGSTKGSSSRHS